VQPAKKEKKTPNKPPNPPRQKKTPNPNFSKSCGVQIEI